jgi:GxxExxY protein
MHKYFHNTEAIVYKGINLVLAGFFVSVRVQNFEPLQFVYRFPYEKLTFEYHYIPIKYKNIKFDEGFRADIIVEDKVILELKSVEKVLPAHTKQVQTYLKLTNMKLGYLHNFNAPFMREGITICVNGLEE